MALTIWLACVLLSCLLVGSRWHEFCSPLGTLLAAQNLPLLWALLIGLKVFHELGHGYACKRFGGQVTEMGAYFILFTPCAYVDASAAWGFPNRFHRVIVSLAGVYFESILAMLALLVWSFTAPGVINSAAQYTVVLSTVVTIGFNINPLMKYDGYYVVSDLLGRPNLRQEATGQVQAELKHVLLGIRSPSLSATWTARLLLAGFGVAAGAYRMLVLLGISVIIALKIPAVGLSVGVAYLAGTLWQFVSKLSRYLRTSPEVAPVRRRALCVLVLFALALLGVLALVPAPGSVHAVGTLARENDCVVHARSSGFLAEASAHVGQTVKSGELLAALENVGVVFAVQKKQAEIDQLQVEFQRCLRDNRGAAAAMQQKIARAQREYDQLLQDQNGLDVQAPINGCVTEAEGLRHSGRFVRKGEPVAIVSTGPWIVEAVANAEDLADHAPQVGQRVQIRLVGQGSRRLTGTILRIARAGSRKIEDRSLTQLAGGDIAVSADTMEAEEPFFEVIVAVDEQSDPMLRHGMTAVVSFGGRRQAIGVYLYRRGLLLLNKLRLAG